MIIIESKRKKAENILKNIPFYGPRQPRVYHQSIHPDYFADELTEALTSGHKHAQFIQMMQARQAKDFYKNILAPLCRKIRKQQLKKFLYRLESEKLLAHDDYSFALMDKLVSTPLPLQ